MKIINTIYSAHLTNENISDAELKAAAAKHAEISEEVLRGRYPDAEIETNVIHGVSGIGAGVQVLDDDGMDDEDTAAIAKSIIERETENRAQEIWA